MHEQRNPIFKYADSENFQILFCNEQECFTVRLNGFLDINSLMLVYVKTQSLTRYLSNLW